MASYEINEYLLNKLRTRYSPFHQTKWISPETDLVSAKRDILLAIQAMDGKFHTLFRTQYADYEEH